jgi:5-oxoprolinase (ATP-hydrolysing) subunit A
LTSRSEQNSMIHDMKFAVNRMIRMVKEGKVTAADGTDIKITADTICVHGDEPDALDLIIALKDAFTKEEILIRKCWLE